MWQDLDPEMAEAFIQNVFKSLFGDQYENYSYDDALKKIQSLKKTKNLSTMGQQSRRYPDI